MAYVKWSGHTFNSAASSTTLTIPSTSEVAAGDAVVVFWCGPYSAGSGVTYSLLGSHAPSSTAGSFTAVSPPDADNGIGTRFRTYRRTATASDSGSTITATNPASGNKALIAYVIGGTTAAVDGTPTKATANATTVTTAAVTTTSGYGAVLVISMWGSTTATITPPAGHTVDQSDAGFITSSMVQTATGTTGTKTSTSTVSAVNSTGLLVINGNNTAPPVALTIPTGFSMFAGPLA